jgi:hypothetical protein
MGVLVLRARAAEGRYAAPRKLVFGATPLLMPTYALSPMTTLLYHNPGPVNTTMHVVTVIMTVASSAKRQRRQGRHDVRPTQQKRSVQLRSSPLVARRAARKSRPAKDAKPESLSAMPTTSSLSFGAAHAPPVGVGSQGQ